MKLTRSHLPINHCAEMLTRTLRSEVGLYAQPQLLEIKECLKKVTNEKETVC
ncbi:hypothetical protein HO995_05005 [Streptococcus suis]|nr:hypothetical protein [Streptococcus suis]